MPTETSQPKLPIETADRLDSADLLPPCEGHSLPLDAPPEFCLGPNPYLADVVSFARPVKPVSRPFGQEISAGKNTYAYDAHTYHTKVPPQGIEPILEHYTRPGDVVLDPFCGSGMTGLAAVRTGRIPVLLDLSPAAAFIAYNFLTPVDARSYMAAVDTIMELARPLEEFLYGTECPSCGASTTSSYTVWSYRVRCPHCKQDFQLWDVARDERPRVRDSKVLSEFQCPHCQRELHKRGLARVRREPVLVGTEHCKSGGRESTAPPSVEHVAWLAELKREAIPKELWYPTTPFPDGVNTKQALAAGIPSVDKAYTPRALWAMAHLWDMARRWPDPELRSKLLFTTTSLYKRVTVFSEFRFWGGSGNIANYNVPAIMNEQNVFAAFHRKAKTISWFLERATGLADTFRIGCQSATRLDQLPDGSVDFVFTDPPFGANINYSEMNLLWESWLGTYTDPTEEAIVNRVQEKTTADYSELLRQALSECRRVLKRDGWMVLVFHNSSERVWRALQSALVRAGFAVHGSQIFDKQHGTFKQFVSTNAVGYDLVLHCRPSEEAELHVVTRGKAIDEARSFIRDALVRSPEDYIVRYLHVARDPEFDYRQLYSQWLSATVAGDTVRLGFDQFRALVNAQLREREDYSETADYPGRLL